MGPYVCAGQCPFFHPHPLRQHELYLQLQISEAQMIHTVLLEIIMQTDAAEFSLHHDMVVKVFLFAEIVCSEIVF